MGISVETERAAQHPVLKRTRIGETFIGGVLKTETRPMQRRQDGALVPVLKANGQPRQELVVTLLTRSGDMVAGLKDHEQTVQPGDVVRLILKGGGFAQWIEAADSHRAKAGRFIEVGDLVRVTTTHAIRYRGDDSGTELGRLDDQADVETYLASANARRETLGWRGGIDLRAPKPEEADFVSECEAKYYALKGDPSTGIAAGPEPGGDAGYDDDGDF